MHGSVADPTVENCFQLAFHVRWGGFIAEHTFYLNIKVTITSLKIGGLAERATQRVRNLSSLQMKSTDPCSGFVSLRSDT